MAGQTVNLPEHANISLPWSQHKALGCFCSKRGGVGGWKVSPYPGSNPYTPMHQPGPLGQDKEERNQQQLLVVQIGTERHGNTCLPGGHPIASNHGVGHEKKGSCMQGRRHKLLMPPRSEGSTPTRSSSCSCCSWASLGNTAFYFQHIFSFNSSVYVIKEVRR